MTEKRFTTDYYNFVRDDRTYIKDNNVRMTYEQIVDLLNTLNDENEQLTKSIEQLRTIIDDNIDFNSLFTNRELSDICNETGWELSEKSIKLQQLEKEDEQLKIRIEDITNESIGYEEQIEKLLKKNEQLKAQLQGYEIDFKQFEKECQECEKGILQIIDDKIQSARELGTVKTVIVLKNL